MDLPGNARRYYWRDVQVIGLPERKQEKKPLGSIEYRPTGRGVSGVVRSGTEPLVPRPTNSCKFLLFKAAEAGEAIDGGMRGA